MKILVYRDDKGFVFGPVDKKEEIEKAVKQQEWFIDDQPDLIEQSGKYKLVGEIEGSVFYAWIKDKTAFIESDKAKIEDFYTKDEITGSKEESNKIYSQLEFTIGLLWKGWMRNLLNALKFQGADITWWESKGWLDNKFIVKGPIFVLETIVEKINKTNNDHRK